MANTTTLSNRTPSAVHDEKYTVQSEADRIFRDIILRDSRLKLPSGIENAAAKVTFDKSVTELPVLPTPLKMTESCSALWALVAALTIVIAEERYGVQQGAVVNSEAATLFLMSSMLVSVDGKSISDPSIASRYMKYDLGRSRETYRRLATNIYPTKDGRFFHLHGSMNATHTLQMLGAKDSNPELDEASAIDFFVSEVKKWDSADIDRVANEQFRQAGTICLTPEEFTNSEQGREVAKSGLYDFEKLSGTKTSPVPWPAASGSLRRPLEGIKMIDVSRVIAAPTIAKLAALFGATVIRVSFDGNPDMGPLLVDGNLGKRDVNINLKTEEGRVTLKELIKDCDIFLDGYRPGALERLGFGPEAVQKIAEEGGSKGIVYIRENCYGWSGPLRNRSGWQQISDCITGASYLQGKFLGHDEPVVPLIPNSDYQTGLIGIIGIMAALIRRNKEGGSYLISVALNYYNLFLITLGLEPPEVQKELQKRHAALQLRHYDDMHRLVAKTFVSVQKNDPQIFKNEYFQTIEARLGKKGENMRFVGPAVKFDETRLQYDIGSCFCGEDEARWP